MDEVPLEDQIVQAKLQTEQAKASNTEMAAQIAYAQASNSKLAAQLEELRIEQEKGIRNATYLCHLYEDKREMERDLARMEGREYRDPNKPDGDWPHVPDPNEPW